MRDTVQTETLTDVAVISRFTSVSDGQGGSTDTYAPFGTVDGHVSPLGGREAEIAAGVAEQSQWVITLPAQTAVDEKDQVAIGGRVYEIDTVRAPRTLELACRVYAHITE